MKAIYFADEEVQRIFIGEDEEVESIAIGDEPEPWTPIYEFSIDTSLTNVTASASNPTIIKSRSAKVLTFTANSGYTLPESITVTGATYSWVQSTGTLVLSYPTDNVEITINGVAEITYDIVTTLTHTTGAGTNPTTIAAGATATLAFTPDTGYVLPDSITVSGASYTWNQNAGTLVLSNPMSNVSITIASEAYEGLCFTANTAGSTVAMKKKGTPSKGQNFSYSTNGSSWTTFTPGTTTVTLSNVGDKVYFKGNNPKGVNQSGSIYYQFVMTGSIAGSGNIMSLIDDGACNTLIIPNAYCYYQMFNSCTSLTTAPELPATKLTQNCYMGMFGYCYSLTTAPVLPATTLTDGCYFRMFYNCTKLTTAPLLPATTLTSQCYASMFEGCKLLTTAPLLPATTLAFKCYSLMFSGCTSINVQDTVNKLTSHIDFTSTTVPQGLQGIFAGLKITDEILGTVLINYTLPATILTDSCYDSMFYNCTSLTTPPILPATTLTPYCYAYMFYNCTSLTTTPALPATTLANYCYVWMFYGCSALYVSDSPVSGTAEQIWTIPASGTFTNTYSQSSMFTSCKGTRSSNDMAGAAGASYTYYTQNEPV